MKQINIAVFGKGNVGGTLIDQILTTRKKLEQKRGISLNIFAIAATKKVLLTNDINQNWQDQYEARGITADDKVEAVIDFARQQGLNHLVAIDNTASLDFIDNYTRLVENGFDLISSNKLANTLSYDSYQAFRTFTKKHNKTYLYETNVGAGLPIIDTIRLLHESGDNITRIKGVFSGTLSYLFNEFSARDEKFSTILQNAIDLGYTEPDPREDLCGNDVGRKLLILARELDLENELEEIAIQNLIPEHLRETSINSFLADLDQLNPSFDQLKADLKDGQVLRYVADLKGDLQQTKGNLSVELVAVPTDTTIGQLKGSDSIFEIYTESYGANPITIMGAGAGAEVTARGVFGDLLRIANSTL